MKLITSINKFIQIDLQHSHKKIYFSEIFIVSYSIQNEM